MTSKKCIQQWEEGSNSPIQVSSPLDDCMGYALRRAQLTMFQDLLNDLSSFGMRPAQFSTLVIIESNPGIAQRDLARALGFDPPQLVTMLNRLESQGLAMRVRRKSDKRSYGLFLSKAGEILLKQLKVPALESHRRSTAHLTADEYTQLLELLRKIYLKTEAV